MAVDDDFVPPMTMKAKTPPRNLDPLSPLSPEEESTSDQATEGQGSRGSAERSSESAFSFVEEQRRFLSSLGVGGEQRENVKEEPTTPTTKDFHEEADSEVVSRVVAMSAVAEAQAGRARRLLTRAVAMAVKEDSRAPTLRFLDDNMETPTSSPIESSGKFEKRFGALCKNMLIEASQVKEEEKEEEKASVSVTVGSATAVELLMEQGLDPNAACTSSGRVTALHCAAAGGHSSVVKVLLEYKADVRAKADTGGTRGITALHLAVYTGAEDTVKLLLVAGADVYAIAMSESGPLTPLNVASSRNHHSIVNIIESAMHSPKDMEALLRADFGVVQRNSINHIPAQEPRTEEKSTRRLYSESRESNVSLNSQSITLTWSGVSGLYVILGTIACLLFPLLLTMFSSELSEGSIRLPC